MREPTKASNGSPAEGQPRWWRISEQEWYKLMMAALTLLATALAVYYAVRRALPDPETSKPVKNNYAILVDRSESMGGLFGDKTKLEAAVDEILGTFETVDSGTTARGLWFFGGGCGVVDENVSLNPDNAQQIRAALSDPPSARGERSLIRALDTAVNGLVDVPVTIGEGDVKTVRQIVVYTDGADECDGDLSRVTTSLDQSRIDVSFWIIGMDLAPTEREQLDDVAQSLPGVGDGPAELIVVQNDEELADATAEVVATATTTTTPPDTDTTTTTDTGDTTTTTDTGDTTTTTDTSDTTTTTDPSDTTTTTDPSDTTTTDTSDSIDTTDTLAAMPTRPADAFGRARMPRCCGLGDRVFRSLRTLSPFQGRYDLELERDRLAPVLDEIRPLRVPA